MIVGFALHPRDWRLLCVRRTCWTIRPCQVTALQIGPLSLMWRWPR